MMSTFSSSCAICHTVDSGHPVFEPENTTLRSDPLRTAPLGFTAGKNDTELPATFGATWTTLFGQVSLPVEARSSPPPCFGFTGTTDIVEPTQNVGVEDDDDYVDRLEDWDRLAHYYQLLTTLNNLRQDSGQSVNDFLATIQPIWDQLAQDTISDYHLHLIQVLMALRPEYESVRAALLHRHLLPTLDGAFEETRLGLIKPSSTDVALAITQ
nr:retrovirus-related Pol polyprotein from transposon TNT 1-94 [Ipomoea batatas]